MTPRNLFNVILKTMGVFFIKDILAAIPQLISSIRFFTRSESQSDALWSLLMTLFILAIYVWIADLLIFKTQWIIDRLKLDKGFNQEYFNFNLPLSSVLNIALVAAGVLIITMEIPSFCRNIFLYFQEKRMTRGLTEPDISYTVYAVAKILIALLLIGERKRIIDFVTTRRNESTENENGVGLDNQDAHSQRDSKTDIDNL